MPTTILKAIFYAAWLEIGVATFNCAIEMWRSRVVGDDRLMHNGAVLHSIEAGVWLYVALLVSALIENRKGTPDAH